MLELLLAQAARVDMSTRTYRRNVEPTESFDFLLAPLRGGLCNPGAAYTKWMMNALVNPAQTSGRAPDISSD